MVTASVEIVPKNPFVRNFISGRSIREAETGSSLDSHLTLIEVYIFLQIFGLISVFLVFFTAVLSSRIRRTTTWYIFMVGWIMWCISFLLLAGHQTGAPPGQGLCTFQAALVYAGPPGNACATLSILLQLHFSMKSTLEQKGDPPMWQTVMVNSGPPVLYVCIFLESLLYGILRPSQVEREAAGMYCHISAPYPSIISAVLVAILCICMIILEIITFSLLYRNWSVFRRLRATSQGGQVSITMIVRISIFSVLPMLALGLAIKSTLSDVSASSPNTNNAGSNITTATLSGAAGLIFGTQKDLFSMWAFWRRKDTPRMVPIQIMKKVETV
ncbi:hypothetical protein K435DRAFT_182881 [Dendrothele bispora CBS 962.96]|uniref:G-protein coupled receptors family 2 profile 2 domain-containing protein n=1 Tax=Dendrothele bispora (strain CBS 962.96) TaxID=1314807 RepID=A0A4S8LXE4_DENBC|nr:hypothetical protein K435DRAFT_182881 [Dendrothele bispora CBS 962.96]